MEGDVEAQRKSAAETKAEAEREAVVTSLGTSKADTSKAAGEMERESPLFYGSGAGGQGMLFNRAAKTWHLKSEKLIDAKMKGPMTGEQVQRMLENGGVKADELKWTGLGDFLKGKFRVTPEQVKAAIAEGGIQLKEVTKGGPSLDFEAERAAARDAGDRGEIDSQEVHHRLDAIREREDADLQDWQNASKYKSYQLPGGENYREMLLAMPSREPASGNSWTSVPGGTNQDFTSGHWDEPNILAHVRFNDRTTPDGKRLLHIEEIQSDWHQKGRDKGYANAPRFAVARYQGDTVLKPGGRGFAVYDTEKEAHQHIREFNGKELGWTIKQVPGEGVPDAPLQKDWHEMAFRRMAKMAAEGGYDGLSWTPGEKQAERYSLSKQVDMVGYKPDGGVLNVAEPGKPMQQFQAGVAPEKLADFIGKEAARKLLSTEPTAGMHILAGSDLKVGGEGMKGFYDKIIPDYARKFGKQWGAKVGEERIGTGDLPQYDGPELTRSQLLELSTKPDSAEEAQVAAVRSAMGRGLSFADAMKKHAAEQLAKRIGGKFVPSDGYPVPTLDITPAMRESVTQDGVAMFQKDSFGVSRSGRPSASWRRYEEQVARIYAPDANSHTVVPASGTDAPIASVGHNVRILLNSIEPDLADGGEWPGVSLPKALVDKLTQKLRMVASSMREQQATLQADHHESLANTIDQARDAKGNAILLGPEGAGNAGEEQLHAWGHRWGAEVGDIVFQVGQHPAVAKARAYLQKQGYSGDVPTTVLEATAKSFNGDHAGAGLTKAQGASLLSEFLDAVAKVRGPEVFDDLPRVRDDIADIISGAREKHGRQAEIPDEGRGSTVPRESDGAAPDGDGSERGERDRSLPQGRDARGSDEVDRPGDGRESGAVDDRGQQSLFKRSADATGDRDEAEPLQDLIEKIKAQPKAKQSIVDRFKKESQRSIDSLSARASDVQRGFASIKGIAAAAWDSYRRPAAWTDWKDATGKFQAAEQFADHAMNQFAAEIKRVVPDKARREAMTNWVEAGGDSRLLKERAALTQDPALRKGYELAGELNPEEKKLAAGIRQYLDTQLERAQEAGLLEQGARNYITHIHEKDQRGFQSLINFGELAPNPAFIKKRVFSSYFEGEQQGFMPRDKDIGFLTAAYHDAFTKALASRSYIRSMLEGRASDGRPLAILGARGKWVQLDANDAVSIIEQQKRPESVADYRSIDHPALRGWNWELTEEDAAMVSPKLFEDPDKALAVQGDLLIHPEAAGKVSNILGKSAIQNSKIGKAALIVSSTLKQSLLSFSGFHQTQEGVHALEHKVLPAKMPELDFSNPKQRALVEHGLVVADFDGQSAFSEGVSGTELTRHLPIVGEQLHAYQHYLFHSYIPRIKMAMAMHALDRNRLRYSGKLTDDQILEMTANQSNAAFGGLNYKMMGRNKTFQDLLRLSLLAPDFLEARGRFVAQAGKPFHQEQRSALIRGALVMYAGARILNYLLNDGDMKLEPDMWNKVAFKGHTVGLRTVQGDLFHLASDPRSFIFNRVNPMTTRPIIEFLTGRDQFGRQKNALSQVKDYIKSAAPIPAQGWLNNIEESWPESIAKAMGVETGKYRTPAEQEAYRQHIANIPDSPDDPDKQDAGRFHSQTEQKLRDGKMSTTDLWDLVEKGKLTPHEAGRIQKSAESSKLENYTKNLTIEQAIKVYEKANAVERQLLRPTIEKKRSELANRTEKQREDIEAKLDKLLSGDDAETAATSK